MSTSTHHSRISGIALVAALSFCGPAVGHGQEVVTALDRTLQKTHMRQEATRVTFSNTAVPAFAPTTIQCGNQSCSVRVEVSSQFFNVTSGNIARVHVKADGVPFPSTGFDVDGGINRPVATLTTVAYLKTDLSPGSHTITVDFDMRSEGGTAEAGIRTLMIQVFAP
jgi:hypothetical protein